MIFKERRFSVCALCAAVGFVRSPPPPGLFLSHLQTPHYITLHLARQTHKCRGGRRRRFMYFFSSQPKVIKGLKYNINRIIPKLELMQKPYNPIDYNETLVVDVLYFKPYPTVHKTLLIYVHYVYMMSQIPTPTPTPAAGGGGGRGRRVLLPADTARPAEQHHAVDGARRPSG